MRLLAPVFANVLLLFAVLGFGSLVRSIYPKEHSRVDAAAMTLLGGLGVVGILLFCVGQFWFTRNSILFVLCVGMLLSVRPALGLLRNWRQWFANLEAPKLPVAIILVVFLVTAIGGMTVLVGDMNHDSIAYHYLGPTVWLKQGVIRAVPDETLTYFPVIVESEYAALMALGGQRAPNLFAVVSLAALLLSAASLAVRMGADRRAVWWALALIASTPAIHIGVYGGFIDAIFAGFVLMAARIAFDANQPRQYAVCGIFCGLAMGTKYTGIMAVGLLALSMIVTAVWTNSHSAQVVKCLAVGGLVAVVVASPFYLRNWVLYGCPIYPPPPGLLRFFSPRGMLPGVMQELLKNVRDTGVGLGRRPMDFLLLPFNLTYHTSNFRGAGGIGLVPLALAPFGQAVLRRDAFAKGMALFAVLQTAGWFLTAQVSRYLIPVYVIALIFGVIGWGYIKQSGRRYSKILAALIIAISVAYGLFMIWSGRAADVRAGLSSKYEARRQHEGTPYFDSFEYINSEPSVKRVLILNPHVAAYFVEKDYVKPFGRWGEQTVPGASSVEQVMERLPSLQVTHILDVKHDGGPFSLLEKPPGLTLVLERADQRIYRVN